MRTPFAASLLVIGALTLPLAGYATVGTDSPKTMVKDSVITTKIKAELAAQKPSSLVRIRVDTNRKGVVTLTGRANTQAAVDNAVSIARATEGVSSVRNRIKVVADD